MRSKRKQSPVDPDKARYLLRKNGLTQRDLARDLDISDASVSLYLSNTAYSQRFWDHFKQVIPLEQAS